MIGVPARSSVATAQTMGSIRTPLLAPVPQKGNGMHAPNGSLTVMTGPTVGWKSSKTSTTSVFTTTVWTHGSEPTMSGSVELLYRYDHRSFGQYRSPARRRLVPVCRVRKVDRHDGRLPGVIPVETDSGDYEDVVRALRAIRARPLFTPSPPPRHPDRTQIEN